MGLYKNKIISDDGKTIVFTDSKNNNISISKEDESVLQYYWALKGPYVARSKSKEKYKYQIVPLALELLNIRHVKYLDGNKFNHVRENIVEDKTTITRTHKSGVIQVRDKSNDYVNSSELLKEAVLSKEQEELTARMIVMIQLMVKKLGTKFRYKNEEDRFDCEQQALMDVLSYWHNFDPEKGSNAFAYFSQIIKMGFAKGFRVLHGDVDKSVYRNSISMSGIITI